MHTYAHTLGRTAAGGRGGAARALPLAGPRCRRPRLPLQPTPAVFFLVFCSLASLSYFFEAFSVVRATVLHTAVAAQALSFLQAGMERVHTIPSPKISPVKPGAVFLDDSEAAAQSSPVNYEPRFDWKHVPKAWGRALITCL